MNTEQVVEEYRDTVYERHQDCPPGVDRHEMYCDYCSKQISPQSRIKFYVTDVDYSYVHEPYRDEFELMRFYGECCNRELILFPTTEANEVLLEADWMPTPKGHVQLDNTELVDASPEGDGIPWDPVEFATHAFKFDFFEFMYKSRSGEFGPEDVVDQLRWMGIDVWDYIDPDGSWDDIDITAKEMMSHASGMKDESELPTFN